jgi:hypothetical protein
MISLEAARNGADPKDTSTASLVFDKPISTKKGNLIFLDAYSLYLKPYERQSVFISMKTMTPEKVEEFFEIMVKDGKSQYF